MYLRVHSCIFSCISVLITLQYSLTTDKSLMYKLSSYPQTKCNSSSASKSLFQLSSHHYQILFHSSQPSILATPTTLASLPKMMFSQACVVLGALLTFMPAPDAFTSICTYQAYRCGYTMVTAHGIASLLLILASSNILGYTNDELTAAVNATSIVPPLTTVQLLNVLYRCADNAGGILQARSVLLGARILEVLRRMTCVRCRGWRWKGDGFPWIYCLINASVLVVTVLSVV